MDIKSDKPIRIRWDTAEVPVKDEIKKEKSIKRAEGYE
jgi:hypothetical protein